MYPPKYIKTEKNRILIAIHTNPVTIPSNNPVNHVLAPSR